MRGRPFPNIIAGLLALILVLALAAPWPAQAEDKLGNPVYRASSGPAEAVVFSGDWIKGFTNYRITVSTTGEVTAGTLEVQARAGIGGYSTLEQTIDLAAPRIMVIQGPVDALKLIPSDFDGESYSVEVLGWR